MGRVRHQARSDEFRRFAGSEVDADVPYVEGAENHHYRVGVPDG
jgi:hypothetical protein